MSLCVVMIDLGNLRDQIFPCTGFAPSGARMVLVVLPMFSWKGAEGRELLGSSWRCRVGL